MKKIKTGDTYELKDTELLKKLGIKAKSIEDITVFADGTITIIVDK